MLFVLVHVFLCSAVFTVLVQMAQNAVTQHLRQIRPLSVNVSLHNAVLASHCLKWLEVICNVISTFALVLACIEVMYLLVDMCSQIVWFAVVLCLQAVIVLGVICFMLASLLLELCVSLIQVLTCEETIFAVLTIARVYFKAALFVSAQVLTIIAWVLRVLLDVV